MRRLCFVALSLILAGCPADPPSNPVDMSEPDMTNTDMAEELTLDGLAPDEGPLEGGTEVTLMGAGFVDGMTVRFGSTTAVDADVTSDGEATATTPASMNAGGVTVVVENPNGDTDSLQGGFTFTGPVGGTVDFCQLQAQSPAAAVSTIASPTLYAFAFVEGVTAGEGQGADVEGELGLGTGGDPEDFDYVPMDFNIDLDGLEEGDLSNDEYGATLTVPDAGTYQYAARFRYDDGAWTYCDLDGSENGVTEDQLGTLEVTALGELADTCKLQFPQIVHDAVIGRTRTFFGHISEEGITGNGTQHPAIRGELFVGPSGVDPSADFSSFTSIPAQVSANATDVQPGEDAYVATYAVQAAGEYAFGFRFSADAGNDWRYCGFQDDEMPTNTFSPFQLGSLTASATPDPIDFCHIWQDTLSDDADTATLPTITVEVFEDPLTVGNDGANSAQLEVEAAAVTIEHNPAWSDATWTALPYKAVGPNNVNNYEYEGTPYTAMNHPAAGTYNVFARVREVGNSTWTYCDIDEDATRVRLSAASRLTVTP